MKISHDTYTAPTQPPSVETLDRGGRYIMQLGEPKKSPSILLNFYTGIPTVDHDGTLVSGGNPSNTFEIIDIRSAPSVDEAGRKLFNGQVWPAEAALLIHQPSVEDDNKTGYLALEVGQAFTLGREDEEAVEHFDLSPSVSRHHAGICLGEDGILGIYDLESTNRTSIVSDPEITPMSAPQDPQHTNKDTDPEALATLQERLARRIAHAKRVEPDELIRTKGNKGQPVDTEYRQNYQEIRTYAVDHITDGDFYESPMRFSMHLQQIHKMADYRVYNRLNSNKRIYEDQVGSFSRGGGRASSYDRATRVIPIAAYYGDPYAARGTASYQEFRPQLPGIDERFLPCDTATRERHGTFFYPEAPGYHQYIERMTHLGGAIEEQIMSEEPNVDIVVDLIARQYQYGACMRPFAQINNSLFMEIANAQLKLAGLKGITHGEMDLVAQRLQPETFVRYFKDRLTGQQA